MANDIFDKEQSNYNKLLEMWREEKKKRQEAEGELTIIKGIGNTSPEMKILRQTNQALKKEICELRNDNRNLSHQIEDQVDRARKAGM
jgi:predicted  nucleic acid-binding Zn-ribbon protein